MAPRHRLPRRPSTTNPAGITCQSAPDGRNSASGLPSGASASFSPASVTSGGSATMTIATSASRSTHPISGWIRSSPRRPWRRRPTRCRQSLVPEAHRSRRSAAVDRVVGRQGSRPDRTSFDRCHWPVRRDVDVLCRNRRGGHLTPDHHRQEPRSIPVLGLHSGGVRPDGLSGSAPAERVWLPYVSVGRLVEGPPTGLHVPTAEPSPRTARCRTDPRPRPPQAEPDRHQGDLGSRCPLRCSRTRSAITSITPRRCPRSVRVDRCTRTAATRS